MRSRAQSGFSLVELLVALALFSVSVGALAGLLLQASNIHLAQQMEVETQQNARICLSMISAALRTAGWDPMNVGLPAVALDADATDGVETIEVFADLNEDGDTDDEMEQVLIRHVGGRVEWRRTSDPGDPFVVLADFISNDADGDGTVEAMFVPDSFLEPTRVRLRITARSPLRDPRTRDYLRYTAESDVVLRSTL